MGDMKAQVMKSEATQVAVADKRVEPEPEKRSARGARSPRPSLASPPTGAPPESLSAPERARGSLAIQHSMGNARLVRSLETSPGAAEHGGASNDAPGQSPSRLELGAPAAPAKTAPTGVAATPLKPPVAPAPKSAESGRFAEQEGAGEGAEMSKPAEAEPAAGTAPESAEAPADAIKAEATEAAAVRPIDTTPPVTETAPVEAGAALLAPAAEATAETAGVAPVVKPPTAAEAEVKGPAVEAKITEEAVPGEVSTKPEIVAEGSEGTPAPTVAGGRGEEAAATQTDIAAGAQQAVVGGGPAASAGLAGAGAIAPPDGAGAGGDAEGEAPKPELDTSSAEGLLQSLSTVPASAFGKALDEASAATPEIQKKEKAELEAGFPEVERPSGLPRIGERKRAEPTKLEKGKAPEVQGEAGRKGKPAETQHQQPRGPVPGSALSTEVSESREEPSGSWWSRVFSRIRNFVGSLPTRDSSVTTSAGPRPRVDMTGEANSQQNQRRKQASDREVGDRRSGADGATKGDFGENDIYPNVPEETLRPTYKTGAPPAGVGGQAVPPSLVPGAARATFDEKAAPWLAGKVAEQQDHYQQEKMESRHKSGEARAEGQRRIEEETAKTRADQEGMQQQAREDVAGERKRWREENQKIVQDYEAQSEEKRREIDKKIADKVTTSEKQANDKLSEAENKADAERKKAEAKAAAEKRKAKKKKRSWWDRVKGAITSVFNAIKKAVNAIFDALRALVKVIIEAAKKIVRGIIELARMAIVGLIKAFGGILKGLVTVALAAFPKAAARARVWIDDKVDKAVDTVNKAAEALKKATDAILGWVGGMLDKILGYLQTLYNVALDVLRMLATGEIFELFAKMKDLGKAAWDGFGLIEGEIWRELLGFDISKDLGPQMAAGGPERREVGDQAAAAGDEAMGDPDNIAFFLQDAIRNDQVVVDAAPELEVDERLLSRLAIDPDGELIIGDAAGDTERSTAGVMADLLGNIAQEPLPGGQEQAEQAATQQDPEMAAVMEKLRSATTRLERLDAVKDMVWAGIKRFWNEKLKPNLWWIIPAVLVALAGIIAAGILTGGAALIGAVGIILKIMVVLFIAHDIAKVTAGLKDYLEKGWAGDVPGAALGFARGIAAGVVAVLMFFLFEYGGRALKAAFKGLAAVGRATVRGARAVGGAAVATGKAVARGAVAVAKGIVKGVLYVGRWAVKAMRIVARMVPKSGRFILRRGKLFFKGLKRTALRAVKKLDDLFQRLKEYFPRFRRFYARRRGRWLDLFAEFNPKRIFLGSVHLSKKEVEEALEDIAKAGRPMDDATRKQFQALAERFGDAVQSGKGLKNIRKELDDFLRQFTPQNLNKNPVLKEVWERTLAKMAKSKKWSSYFTKTGKIRVKAAKDPQVMKELYEAARGNMKTQMKRVMNEIDNVFGPMKTRITELPKNVQLHHLLYKSKYPREAVNPENLVLALRKMVKGKPDELHGLLHWVSAGALKAGGKSRWDTLLDEMIAAIKRVYKL